WQSRRVMPRPTSPTLTSAAARTASPSVSSSPLASDRRSTITACPRDKAHEREGTFYGSAEYDYRVHHPVAYPAYWPVRFSRPGNVPLLCHHHDRLVRRQSRPERP